MYKLELGSIRLWVTKKRKKNPKAPAMEGTTTIECPHCKAESEMQIAMWVVKTKYGLEFYSGSIEPITKDRLQRRKLFLFQKANKEAKYKAMNEAKEAEKLEDPF